MVSLIILVTTFLLIDFTPKSQYTKLSLENNKMLRATVVKMNPGADFVEEFRITPYGDLGPIASIFTKGNTVTYQSEDWFEGYTKDFQISLEKNTDVYPVALYYYRWVGNIYLLFEMSDMFSGAIYLYGISDTHKVIWKKKFGGFNLGNAIIERNYIYACWMGEIIKIDMKTGDVAWVHENLYKYSKEIDGTSFSILGVDKENIALVDNETKYKILLDKETGLMVNE